MLIEAESANSGENVVFSRRLLKSKGIDPDNLILVKSLIWSAALTPRL